MAKYAQRTVGGDDGRLWRFAEAARHFISATAKSKRLVTFVDRLSIRWGDDKRRNRWSRWHDVVLGVTRIKPRAFEGMVLPHGRGKIIYAQAPSVLESLVAAIGKYADTVEGKAKP